MKGEYTCEKILGKLKAMNFADIQEQGYVPLYTRDKLTDALHKICGFETDFQFITKSHMRTIQKKANAKKQNTIVCYKHLRPRTPHKR